MSNAEHKPDDPLVEPLTRREREILDLLDQGFSAPEIAEQLTLAVSSVKWHQQQLYGKLGVNSKRQALNRARELGLLGAPAAMAGDQGDAREAAPYVPSGTVTFLFTDIEGSTKLLEQLREGYAAVLSDQRDLLRAAFAHYGGHEIDTQGDAFFVAFPRAQDAVNCVIEAQQALARHAWPVGVAVRVRMGVHTGEPILGSTGYVGMDVHRAARIAAAGHGGQVLLSQTTRDLIYQDLPTGTSLRALGEHKLKDIHFPQTLYQLEVDGLPSEFAPLKTLASDEEAPAPGEPPFKGLQYFDEDDADWFFGRDSVITRLVTRVCAERFLAVIGASGSGKSSVVRAGLLPALKRAGRAGTASASLCPDVSWWVCLLTPTAHPLEALASSLTHQSESVSAAVTLMDDMRGDRRSLHLFAYKQLQLAERGDKGPQPDRLLIVVDQLEELFTLCRDEAERAAFVDNLLTAVEAETGGVSVVLTLRADFYQHLAPYLALSAAVAQHQEYLGAMNTAALRQAIEAPAERGGWQFSPGLVDLLLHDVGAGQGGAPEPGALPLLSHALLETWKHRRGNMMSLRAYTESGGVRGAIAHTAEGVFRQELTPAQQAIARGIFLRLTELGEGTQDTRRRVSYQELYPEGQSAEVEEVLARLADARLITTSAGTVEVAHEALIREWPTLRQWLDEDREGLRLHRHLTEAAQSWAAFNRDPSELYRGTRLSQALEWSAAHPGQANALEQAFLEAARGQAEHDAAERDAAQRRELEAAQQLAEAQEQRADTQASAARQLRRRAVYLFGALVVALAAALVAVVFGQRANLSALSANQNLSTAQAAQATAQGETNALATEQGIAQANFTRAEAQQFGAEAVNLSNAGGSSELIALLALRSMKLQVSPQGHAALQVAAALAYPLRIFAPGQGALVDAEFSPDGRYLLTSYFDPNLGQQPTSVWNIQTGELMYSYYPQGGYLGNRGAFSPDGQSIAVCDLEDAYSLGLLEIFDAATGHPIRQFFVSTCSTIPLWLDNQSLLLGEPDYTIRLFDVASGHERRRWETNGAVRIISPRARLALVTPDTGAVLWNLVTNTPVMTGAVPGGLNGAAFSPDETYAALGLGDGSIQIWQTDTGQVVTTLRGHTAAVTALDFSPDGKFLLSGSTDGSARLWSVEGWREVRHWSVNAPGVNTARFAPDGRTLVTGGGDGVVRLWTVQAQPEWPVLVGHTGELNGVAFSPDGQTLATAGADEVVRLWDIHTGQTTRIFPGNGFVNFGLRFSLDGKQLLVATGNGIATLWDVATGSRIWQTQSNSIVGYNDVAFSPDGQVFVMSGDWGSANVTYAIISDSRTGQEIRRATIPLGPVEFNGAGLGVEYSPDGRTIVLATTDKNARVLDANSGQIIYKLTGHTDAISGARFSPDGRYIATASVDKSALLWDVATGQKIRSFVGHTAAVYTASFSPAGKLLATASQDGTVRVWDVASGQELRRYAADAIAVRNVAWSPDGKLLASVGDDGTAKLWDVDYHTTIAYLCGRLQRDLTDAERAQYNIADTAPTCGK